MYQLEAIKRVVERFAGKTARRCIVQATGTGKTRVAVSLCDVLIRAGWAKRILFLCDRRELRKQADNVFKEFLPGEPRVVVTAATRSDRDKRIYLATYPAMMKCFENFDVGFFDLIIADESHRSIYNRYRELFEYFDALQVGLTATPVQLRRAQHLRAVRAARTRSDLALQLRGRGQLEAGLPRPVRGRASPARSARGDQVLADERRSSGPSSRSRNRSAASWSSTTPSEIDKYVFNKDTNRLILRNLMEHGIREATGSRVGKTIIFARNHNHAVLLQTSSTRCTRSTAATSAGSSTTTTRAPRS